MINLLFVAVLLVTACSDDQRQSAAADPVSDTSTVSVATSNTCDTAIDFNATTLEIITPGDVWLNYTGTTDKLQIDTCSSEQGGTFEVYHNCEWYEAGRGTINGRDQQKVNDCYPGYYGDVLGIRGVSVKIRVVATGDTNLPYYLNFNEVGY